LRACGGVIVVMRCVEDGVGVRICIYMLTRCWVHADYVQAACERFMKVGFHCGPNLGVDHFPIVEVFYREDVRLP
jgi:uncharacterized protein YraI